MKPKPRDAASARRDLGRIEALCAPLLRMAEDPDSAERLAAHAGEIAEVEAALMKISRRLQASPCPRAP